MAQLAEQSNPTTEVWGSNAMYLLLTVEEEKINKKRLVIIQ